MTELDNRREKEINMWYSEKEYWVVPAKALWWILPFSSSGDKNVSCCSSNHLSLLYIKKVPSSLATLLFYRCFLQWERKDSQISIFWNGSWSYTVSGLNIFFIFNAFAILYLQSKTFFYIPYLKHFGWKFQCIR